MALDSVTILKKIWRHSRVRGNVWISSIKGINTTHEKFVQGTPYRSDEDIRVHFTTGDDWYFTPAVSCGSRKKKDYPAQRVVWVDCDDSYDEALLVKLRPSFCWETSPGHKQAVWLLKDKLAPTEYSRDGFVGLLTQVVSADKSGVDIGQLLRVPGTNHHKGEEFKGKILIESGAVYTTSQLLARMCRLLGFSPQLASEISADEPYGDRSKQLWKFECSAAELGLPQDIVFKLCRASKWNKWRDDPEALKEDISKAYKSVSNTQPRDSAEIVSEEELEDAEEFLAPWELKTPSLIGDIVRTPMKWSLPNIIPQGGCGFIVSPPKVGKTRIAMEIALGLTTKGSPLGINTNKQLKVGFFSIEDGEYLFSKRLSHTLNTHSMRYPHHWDGHINEELEWHPSRDFPLHITFDPIDLSAVEERQRLYETIIKYSIDLIFIDTLSMAIGKADVNNSKDMYIILKDIKQIAKATSASVIFIHHTRKRIFDKESVQEKILGSTALHAWADCVISVHPPTENTNLLKLHVQTKLGGDEFYLTEEIQKISEQ